MMTKTTLRSILGVLWRILGMKRTIISRKEGQWFRSWNVMWYSFRNLLFEMSRLFLSSVWIAFAKRILSKYYHIIKVRIVLLFIPL